MARDLQVHEQSCRGCEMCVDICPTRVFEIYAAERLCKLFRAYLGGVMDGLLHRPLKSSAVAMGELCQVIPETL